LRVEDGEFVLSETESLVFEDANKKPQPLRVTATFSGQQREDNKDNAVEGEATLYLNSPAPAGKWMTWGSAVIAALLAISLIILFTGEMTRRRARLLFSITYIMCFVSVSVPIWAMAAVSKSEHAVDMMEQAPMGLIKGTAKGVQRPQWLVNVGGAVEPPHEMPTKEEAGSPPAKGVLAKEPDTGHPSGVEGPTATPTGTATPSATPQQSPTPQENIALDEPRQVPGFALVKGGLAVPFYVIILAVLGAGINMTKNVPDIQKNYNCKVHLEDEDPFWKGLLKAPMAVGLRRMDPEQAAVVSDIRKELIDNYMGLISAPFLAIAVYYLLQVVATNVAEPLLVVVSFATGFISHKIITAITTLAARALNVEPNGTPPKPNGTPPKPSGTPPKPNGTPPKPNEKPPKPNEKPPKPNETPQKPNETPQKPSGVSGEPK
jgi:hypothetical protein